MSIQEAKQMRKQSCQRAGDDDDIRATFTVCLVKRCVVEKKLRTTRYDGSESSRP
jgi:hypothetical protein